MARLQTLLVSSLALVITVGSFAHASSADRLFEKPISLGESTNDARQSAGYFRLKHTYAGEMFYLYFKPQQGNDTDAPVVLWMTGGPGCSSELAVFYEQGPYRIQPDLELKPNPYSWDQHAHMIFVDQPVNTGFSYSEDSRDRVYNEKVVAADMVDFLTAFFDAHPELKDNDFFVTGESYGGHYVPAVASHIFKTDNNIPLKGLAVGNGLTDPAVQFAEYGTFALQNKLISAEMRSSMSFAMPVCKIGAQLCNYLEWSIVCTLALTYCQSTQFVPILAANPGINVYDIRKKCIGPLCYDFTLLDKYINQPKVREELGVGDRKWQECSTSVNQDMIGDWLRRYDQVLPEMLEAGVRVMIYAGTNDLICNWVGNKRWVDELPWAGAGAWSKATMQQWQGGEYKTVGPLSFVKVAGAGHMVPMDQPEHAFTMITAFIQNTTLQLPASGAELVAMA